MLHDRRIPGSRANIDHIAVAPYGIWVLDAKRYKGKLTISNPIFGAAKLTINRRDRSGLIDGLRKQVELVRHALDETAPDVAVHGVLCFIETELPLLGTPTFQGYALLRAKALAKRLNADGPIDPARARALAGLVAERFPNRLTSAIDPAAHGPSQAARACADAGLPLCAVLCRACVAARNAYCTTELTIREVPRYGVAEQVRRWQREGTPHG